jgi:hypothetical protein
MKALVYGGPGLKEWKEVPDPKIVKNPVTSQLLALDVEMVTK